MSNCPHGQLDPAAAGMLLREPWLSNAQIAKALGCNPKTLANQAKYPTLARVRAFLEDQRGERLPLGSRPDRRRNGRTSLDFDGEES